MKGKLDHLQQESKTKILLIYLAMVILIQKIWIINK